MLWYYIQVWRKNTQTEEKKVHIATLFLCPSGNEGAEKDVSSVTS